MLAGSRVACAVARRSIKGWRKAANSVWLQRKEMQEARQEATSRSQGAAQGLSHCPSGSGLHPGCSGSSVSIPGGAVTSPRWGFRGTPWPSRTEWSGGGPSGGFQRPLQWPPLFLSFSGARSEAEEDNARTREARPGSHGGNPDQQ